MITHLGNHHNHLDHSPVDPQQNRPDLHNLVAGHNHLKVCLILSTIAHQLRTGVGSTIASKSAATTATATSCSRTTRISEIYFNSPAVKLLLIHTGDSMACLLSQLESDKAKTPRPTSVTVTHDDRLNGSTQ